MKKLIMNLMMLFVLLTPITLQADSTTSTKETYQEGSIVNDVDAGTIIEMDLTFTTEGVEVEGFMGINLNLFKEQLKKAGAEMSDDDIINSIKSIMPSAKIIEIDGTKVIRCFDSMDLEELADEDMDTSDLVNSDGTLNLNNAEIDIPLGDLQEISNSSYSLSRKFGNVSDINSISVGLKVNVEEGYKIVDNSVGTIEDGSLVYATTDYDGIDDVTFTIKKDTIFTTELLLLIGGIILLIVLIVVIVILVKASKKNKNQPQGPAGPNPVGPMNPNPNMPINNQGVKPNNQNVMPTQQPQSPQMNQVNNPQVQPMVKPNPQVMDQRMDNVQPVNQQKVKPMMNQVNQPQGQPTPQVGRGQVGVQTPVQEVKPSMNNVSQSQIKPNPQVVNQQPVGQPVVKPQITPNPQVVTNNVEINQQPGSVNHNNPLEKPVVNNNQNQDVNNGLNN